MSEPERDVWQEALIDAALDAVIVIDDHGLVLDFNHAAESSFGYRKSDVIGKPMVDLIVPPSLREAHNNGLERLRSSRIPKILGKRLELPAVRSDGTEFPVELLVVEVATEPRPVYVGYLRDISEQKLAEQTLRSSEERFRNLADTAPAMIWLADSDNQRTWFNRVWLDFVGETLENQLGHAWLQRVHPEDLERVLRTYDDAQESQVPYSIEFRLNHHDGSYRWILDHGTPVCDGVKSYSGYAGTCIDITERRKAEADLRLTQFTVDNAGDAVFWVGPDAELVYTNNRACESLGYTREELSQLRVWDFSPEFPPDQWGDHWKELQRTGGYTFETLHQRKDGSTFPVEISINYVEAEGQQLNFAFVRDLTDRREQELRIAESEAKLRAISDAAIDAVVLIDGNGRIAHWNPAAAGMFGYSTEEIASFRIDSILDTSISDTPLENWDDWFQAGDSQIFEMTARRRDGSVFPVELSLSRTQLDNHNQSWAVAVIRDATERKKVERQLKTALHDAKAANRAKSEFLALVSHEMRTPLNSILGMIELVLDTGLTPDQGEMLSTSRQSGQQLKRLISDMLDYSQIQIGRFDLRSGVFDLHKLLVRLREEYSQRAQSNGLEFRWQVASRLPQDLMGDERRLEQVIENILDNAIKFTETGFVALSVTWKSASKDHVRLQFKISDSGAGVEPQNQERIFNRFEQEDSSSTRSYGGIGLGLSICKQLVERMGGKIGYTERPGGGSEFTFDVLMQANPQHGTPAPTQIAESFTDLEGRTVLLAEDDPPSRAVASRMLEKAGVRVLQAIDGLDAVEKFEASNDPIDAVFMDMMMPRLDGLEAAEQIRKLHPHVPIIAMTAQAMKGDRERILAAGIDDYVPKPIERKLVLRALQNALGDAELPDQEASDTATDDSASFDYAALFSRCDEDEDLYHEIVRLFLETCDETLARIDRSLVSGDVEELIQAAHRLKGAVGNMCAPKSLSMAAQLEAAAREGDLEKVHLDYAQLRLEVQQLRTQLNASTR